jgi:UDP-glucose 4-epimerase
MDIPFIFTSRREGDLPEFWADTNKAKKLIGWQAKLTLSEMMRDSWNWQRKNPKGYPK